jgi:hypothetical protein
VPAAPPNSFTILDGDLESDDDFTIKDGTPPFVAIPTTDNIDVSSTPIIEAPTGSTSIDLERMFTKTHDSILELKGLLASRDHDHKREIANAYSFIQAMLTQFIPTFASTTASIVECTKSVEALPVRVAEAVLPTLTTTIHTVRDNLSTTMASTLTSASSIFGAKMDEAILRLNDFGKASQTQTATTITDSLDLRLLSIHTALISLENRFAALHNPNSVPPRPVDPGITSDGHTPPCTSLVVDTSSSHESKPASVGQGSRLFPNVDPGKLFPNGDTGPSNPAYRASSNSPYRVGTNNGRGSDRDGAGSFPPQD